MRFESAVRFEGVSMKFPGVLANDDISLEIRRGEVFALVGENGAGKTTLMKILFGLHKPTDGRVFVKGKELSKFSPAESISAGIGMVHQHFMLVPSFTVAQNIALGREPTTHGTLYDHGAAEEAVRGLVKKYGLEIDPRAKVQELSLGEQQRVEILKTLHMGADILILDEPTAVLTPQESSDLFNVLRGIVEKENKTVVIITHKLYEVMAVSDRVGVLRGGKLIGTWNTCEVNEGFLASQMVGREVLFEPLKRTGEAGDRALAARDITVYSNRSIRAVDGLSFELRFGEILGVAGVEGNGQSELVEALTGMRKMASGSVQILSKDCSNAKPGEIRKLGLVHVPEDRIATGLAIDASVSENLIMGKQRKDIASRGGVHLLSNRIREFALGLTQKFNVSAADVIDPVSSLSGGNMQKIVVAREFTFPSKVMVISQPTRGIDIGAARGIHELIVKKRNEGAAILLISADLDEILRLSDRIIVLFEGRIIGEFAEREFDKQQIGLCMAGIKKGAGI